MTATKTLRTIVAAATPNAAGGTTTGTAVNLTTALGAVLTGKITNGGTGPTIGCDFVVEVSGDGTNWKEFARQTAPITALAVTQFVVEIPTPVMHARAVFTGNTVQAVTVECFAHELTSIG